MGWQTPDNVLDLVRAFAPIGLDPCTTVDNPVRANYFIAPPEDGLVLSWAGLGLVFVNPPYGRALPAWARRMADEGARGTEIIGLVPARPDTQWFQTYITTATALLFWRGRLKFKGAKDAAPFPSLLPYWGPRVDQFRAIFGRFGWIP